MFIPSLAWIIVFLTVQTSQGKILRPSAHTSSSLSSISKISKDYAKIPKDVPPVRGPKSKQGRYLDSTSLSTRGMDSDFVLDVERSFEIYGREDVRVSEVTSEVADDDLQIVPRSSLTSNVSDASLLGEIDKMSMNPLMDAFGLFSDDLDRFFAGTTDILVNTLPKTQQFRHITGIKGDYVHPKDMVIGETHDGVDERVKFRKGEAMTWKVRWDYDDRPPKPKYVHVNSDFYKTGVKTPVKYAWRLLPGGAQYWTKGPMDERWLQTSVNIFSKMNRLIGYVDIVNLNEPIRVWPDDFKYCLAKITDYFRRVAKGEIIPK